MACVPFGGGGGDAPVARFCNCHCGTSLCIQRVICGNLLHSNDTDRVLVPRNRLVFSEAWHNRVSYDHIPPTWWSERDCLQHPFVDRQIYSRRVEPKAGFQTNSCDSLWHYNLRGFFLEKKDEFGSINSPLRPVVRWAILDKLGRRVWARTYRESR